MTTPTAGELALLRTQPHRSKLYLSIFEPQTVFAARVNDLGAAKGDMVITYDTVTTGNYLASWRSTSSSSSAAAGSSASQRSPVNCARTERR